LKECMEGSLVETVCLDGLRSENALPFKQSDFSSAVKKGWWEVAREVIVLGKQSGMEFESEVDMEHRILKQKIDRLKTTAKQSLANGNYITPAFQWAQSKDALFLEVKFAHKMDAPSYAHTKIDDVAFAIDTMNLTASGKDKSFKLNLRFHKDILPENCTWSASSAGRVTVTVPKKNGNVSWSRPLKGKQPQNMLVWWAMKEKFEKEINEIEKPLQKAKNATKKEDIKKDDLKLEDDKKYPPQSESQKQLQASLKKLTEGAKEKIESHEKEARAKKKSIDEEAKLKKTEIEKEFQDVKAAILKETEEGKSAERERASSNDGESHEEL